MGKRVFFIPAVFFILVVLVLSIAAAELTFEKETIHDTVVKELSQPAIFSVKVKNHANKTDFFEFYTFVDAMLSPKGSTTISANNEMDIELRVYPSAKLRDERKGSYTFVYYMKTSDEIKEDRLVIKILPLDEILKLDFPDAIDLDAKEIRLGIENQENIVIDDVLVSAKGAFIDASQKVSFAPFGKQNITLAADRDKLKNILAGKYLVKISFTIKGVAVDVVKEIEVTEKISIASTEEDFGTLFYPSIKITKTNEGNKIADAEIMVRKNIFANAFTSFSLKADEVRKSATSYTFMWHKSLRPGESFSVEVRTNYILPLGILLAAIVAAVLVTIWLKTSLIVRKKAVRIRSKTGEFAIKIMLLVKARDSLNNIFIRDRLPRLAELHERYGTIKPSNVDKERRIIEWHIPHLNKGEEHIISYVIYSKVSVLGKFEMPRASVSFDNMKGEHKSTASNAVLFFSEERVPL